MSNKIKVHTGIPSPFSDTHHLSVTVIIRSSGRPSLAKALESVAAQTWPRIDVLIVDATGGNHPPLPDHCGGFGMRMVSFGRALNRPQAANAGLDHARGDWLIFLDDDDRYAPNHVESLLQTAHLYGTRVAYSATQLFDVMGRPLQVLAQPYSRIELHNGNYIQMGAAIFHRDLLAAGCRFDEDMILFQDWDFWLQLSQHGTFAYSGQATNLWNAHQGGSGAGTGGNADASLQQTYGDKVRAKWADVHLKLQNFVRASGIHANRLIERGRPLHAARILRRALQVSPTEPGLINLLGIARYRQGDLTGAWHALNTAHRMLPESVAVDRNLARVQRALKDRAKQPASRYAH